MGSDAPRSKLSQRNGKYAFLTSSAQTTAEFCKLLISLGFFARDTLAVPPAATLSDVEGAAPAAAPASLRSPVALWRVLRGQVSEQLLLHTGGLALLYCFNNQLAFSLFRWADAATVTLIKSASSIVSAILLWVLLSRPIAPLQWHAISLQVLGLFIVQYDSCKGAALLPLPVYLALFGSLFISSGAGVWNEHVLKTFGVSMHIQNCCLYAFGVAFNLAVFVFLEQHGGRGLAGSYFHGYNAAAVGVIFCQAVLGLVVTGARAAGRAPRSPPSRPCSRAQVCRHRHTLLRHRLLHQRPVRRQRRLPRLEGEPDVHRWLLWCAHALRGSRVRPAYPCFSSCIHQYILVHGARHVGTGQTQARRQGGWTSEPRTPCCPSLPPVADGSCSGQQGGRRARCRARIVDQRRAVSAAGKPGWAGCAARGLGHDGAAQCCGPGDVPLHH